MPTFTAPLKGGAATLPGTVTFPGGITPATLGMAFDGAGVMRVEAQNPSNLYNVLWRRSWRAIQLRSVAERRRPAI